MGSKTWDVGGWTWEERGGAHLVAHLALLLRLLGEGVLVGAECVADLHDLRAGLLSREENHKHNLLHLSPHVQRRWSVSC